MGAALVISLTVENWSKGNVGRYSAAFGHRQLGAHMRVANFAVLGLLALAACDSRGDDMDADRRAGEGADTMVTTEQTVDTTIVTQDTSVDVDTTRKEGDRPIRRDTVQR